MSTSVLTIEELTGTKRRLDLIGSGLPHKGASWGGQTILATQWNAGNPTATQHVLSPQEDPSAWEGFWSTTMLVASPCQFTSGPGASPQKVVVAASLDRIVEDLRVGGQLLRVTWTNQNGGREAQKIRLGRLQMYKGDFDSVDLVKWSMTFEWISRGQVQSTVNSTQDDVLAATRDSIIRQNAVVATITENAIRASRKQKNQTTQFRLGDLENLANAPLAELDRFARVADSFTREMQQIGDLILKVRGVPFAVAGRALATATNAVAVSNQFLDSISRKGPEQLALGTNAALLAQTLSYYGKSQTQAQLMADINQQLAQRARLKRSSLNATSTPGQASQMRQSDVLALYLPKDGDTFARISFRFYETGDLGMEIARVNGYSSYAVTPPRRVALLIPTKAVIDARVAAGL